MKKCAKLREVKKREFCIYEPTLKMLRTSERDPYENMRNLYSFPMVYHLDDSDKHFGNYEENTSRSGAYISRSEVHQYIMGSSYGCRKQFRYSVFHERKFYKLKSYLQAPIAQIKLHFE
jgi:hypothetical protein